MASEDEQFKKWTKTTFETFQQLKNKGFIPSIVILEFYKFLLSNLGKQDAELRASPLLKLDLQIVDLDVPIAIEAAKLRCKYGKLPTTDAVIAATATKTGCDYVLTDDNHIKQIKETKTKWI